MGIDFEAGSVSLLIRLMNEIQRRDQIAFEEFYHRTKRKIFGTVLMIIPHRASAEDVVQEVYARIWNNALSYDSTKSSPITWAAIIARNLSIDRIRRRKLNGDDRKDELEFEGRANIGELENVACPRKDVLEWLPSKRQKQS
jgi:RNA polymerase sigma factor (sigma-70 family)